MIIRELAARLGLDIDGAAFEAADALLSGVRTGLVAIGAFAGAAAAGMAAAVATTARYADQIDKAAQRTGIAVEPLQALQYAAERAGVGVEGLQGAMAFMARRGVKDFEGELRRAADELSRMPAGGARAARAMELFGKQGAALIPMLSGGAAGLDALTAKARAMGIVLGDDTIRAGAAVQDAIEDLQGYLRGLAYAIAGPLLKPAREWLETMSAWVRAHRQVIASKMEQFARVLGTALRWTWQILEPFVKLFTALATNTWVVRAAIVALGAALLAGLGGAAMSAAASVMKLVGALLGLTAAEAASVAIPIAVGLALTALALIVEDVFRFIRGEKSLLGEFSADILSFYDRLTKIDPSDSAFVRGLKYMANVLFDIEGTLSRLRVMWATATGNGPDAALSRKLRAAVPGGIPHGDPRIFDPAFMASVTSGKPYAPSRFLGGGSPAVVNVGRIEVDIKAPLPETAADAQRVGYDIAAAIREQLGLEIGAAAGGLLLRPEGG